MERWKSRLVSGLSFAASRTSYEELLITWAMLSRNYPGWSYTEIRELSPRERENWLEIAKHYTKLTRK